MNHRAALVAFAIGLLFAGPSFADERAAEPVQTVAAVPEGLTKLRMNRDGSMLLGITGDLKLWSYDLANKAELKPAPIEGNVTTVGFSPDGLWRAIGTSLGELHVESVKDNVRTTLLLGKAIERLDFADNGSAILAMNAGNEVAVWSLATKERLCRWDASALAPIRGVAIIDDSLKALVIGERKSATYTLADGKLDQEMRVTLSRESLGRLAVPFKFRFRFFTGNFLGVDDYLRFQPTGPETSPMTALSPLRDGQYMAVGYENGRLEVATTTRFGTVWRAEQMERAWTCVAASQDGRTVAGCDGEQVFVYRLPEKFRDPRLPNDKVPLLTPKFRFQRMGDVVFVPGDELRAVAAGPEHTLLILDLVKGVQIQEIDRTRVGGAVSTFRISPNGQWMLIGGGDNHGKKSLRLWDARKWQEVRNLEGHKHQVVTIAFSPDSKTALTGSYDETTRLWDLATGEQLQKFGEEKSLSDRERNDPNPIMFHAVQAVGFSRYGKYAAERSERGLKVWTTSDWKPLPIKAAAARDTIYNPLVFTDDDTRVLTFEFPTFVFLGLKPETETRRMTPAIDRVPITSFALSLDEKRLAYCDINGIVHLYNREQQRVEARISAHEDYLKSIHFSPDGRYLLTGGDGQVLLTELP